MSGSHDTHHSSEQKPVAFTVPLILASVLILIIVLFLSLCDPKPHHHGEAAHGDHAAAIEATHHHDAAAPAEHHDAAMATEPVGATVEAKNDSTSAKTIVPAAGETYEDHH